MKFQINKVSYYSGYVPELKEDYGVIVLNDDGTTFEDHQWDRGGFSSLDSILYVIEKLKIAIANRGIKEEIVDIVY